MRIGFTIYVHWFHNHQNSEAIVYILLRESGVGFRWNMIILKIERRSNFTNEIKNIKEVFYFICEITPPFYF